MAIKELNSTEMLDETGFSNNKKKPLTQNALFQNSRHHATLASRICQGLM
jgi:hypothetical protein